MIRPKTPTLSEFSGMGFPASALKTNGISEIWVTRLAVTTSQNRDDENLGCNTIVPPTPRVVQKDQLWAFTWKNGRYTRYVSSGPIEMFAGPLRAAQSALAWVCTTAFGRDVVPEVNMMPAGASGSGARSGSSSASAYSEAKSSCPCTSSSGGAASPPLSSVTITQPRSGTAEDTTTAYWGWVMAPTQPVFSTKNRISSSTLRVFVVTPTAPRVAHAYHARTISGQLSEWMSTLSPATTPRRASPAARLRTEAQNSA